MADLLYLAQKWVLTAFGRNSFNCNQDEGKAYSKDTVAGYYNNLTEKITKFGLPMDKLPQTQVSSVSRIYFAIDIFQYGIAAYDLYLINKDESMLVRLKAVAEWALNNQQENGGWRTFEHKKPDFPYSSMAQGEAISMLIRAHIAFGDSRYLDAVVKAKSFMMLPVSEGGTAVYEDSDLLLYEYINDPLVLNGWIFSAWGLYDYAKYFNDIDSYRYWENTVAAIAKRLPRYDKGYWSLYWDNGKSLANPFYHKLHIAMLNTMYDLTGIDTFKTYSILFSKYQKNWFYNIFVFIKKVFDKVKESI